MSRKSLGPFSGLHLTIIIVAIIVVAGIPGTVWAVDSFSNVAIEDPATGVKASVDTQHRLQTLATLRPGSATETAPANLVRLFRFPTPGCTALYTLPVAKALIVKAASGYLVPSAGGTATILLYADSSCTDAIAAFTSDRQETVNVVLGTGAPIKGALYGRTTAGGGSVNVYGYLVPASSVP
jgi:hypothetical protein